MMRQGGAWAEGCFVLAPWADALACMTGYAQARPTSSTNSALPASSVWGVAALAWDKNRREGQTLQEGEAARQASKA